MRLTIHQLNVFNRVAELESVSLAAESLYMTQPAVSNILHQLEEYYQCELVQVINRKLYLTEFGKVLLEMSNELSHLLKHYKTKIQAIKGLTEGEINVSIATTAKYFMPHFLGEFKKTYPNIHIKMKVYHRELIVSRLEKNQDDFVILSHPPNNFSLDIVPIFFDELVIVAAPKHPFAKKRRILSIHDLSNDSWIIREPGSGTRIAMLDNFEKQDFYPKIEMELGNNEAIKQAIMADLGVSVVSKKSVQHELQHGLLTMLNVDSFPIAHPWYFVKLKDKKLSPIAEGFLKIFNAVNTNPHKGEQAHQKMANSEIIN